MKLRNWGRSALISAKRPMRLSPIGLLAFSLNRLSPSFSGRYRNVTLADDAGVRGAASPLLS
jgi:hypothetical protein